MDNHNNTDCGIIDLKDDSSDEYTLESSEEEYDDEEEEEDEEDRLKSLDLDSSSRFQQLLFDLQYKMQNKTITNIDIEVTLLLPSKLIHISSG